VRNSIRLKLFIAFLLTTFLVVAGMHVFMRWSLERGFNQLIESRQQEKIEQLILHLSNEYAESESWESLTSSKRQWMKLLRSNSAPQQHPRQWMKRALREPDNSWPPKFPKQVYNNRITPLNLRLMLLNADKSIIYGRSEGLSKLTLHPIYYQDETIGFLGLLPGKPLQQLNEIQFITQQGKAFIWIALLMIALSAGLALLLAYIFGRRLKKITAATKVLGMGHYSMRLPVDSTDELGQLAQNFNEMAIALEQSEQARQRWVADISHELRTPLAILRGELEALQDGIRPMTPDAINSLSSEVIRLTRLTDDLYQLTLSDHGALTYRKTKLDPIKILKQSITGLMPKFDNKQLTVNLITKTNNISLYADADRLSQLFKNLLNNSANYTDNEGQLDIIISKMVDTLHIDFSDSAPSVPKKNLNQLFDRLYRVEKSRNRNLGGAGLGLAICKNIVAAHNGTISAHNSSLGGLSIHIEFPIQ